MRLIFLPRTISLWRNIFLILTTINISFLRNLQETEKWCWWSSSSVLCVCVNQHCGQQTHFLSLRGSSSVFSRVQSQSACWYGDISTGPVSYSSVCLTFLLFSGLKTSWRAPELMHLHDAQYFEKINNLISVSFFKTEKNETRKLLLV